MVESLLKDIRHGARSLSRQPAFSATVVLTLALGIGANTAIFTLVHAVMLKSLPVSDPQQLVRFGDRDACCVISGHQAHFSIFSSSLYTYLRDHTPELSEMAAAQADRVPLGVRRLGANELAEPFIGEHVSGNYFSMLGIRAFAGRLTGPADDAADATPVAVMSYATWERRFGLNPSVVGSTLEMGSVAVTVAGIAPPGFFGDNLRRDPCDFWLPLSTEPLPRGRNSLAAHPDQHWLYIIGRPKPGVQLAAVESKLNVELHEEGSHLTAQAAQEIARQHIALTPAGGGVAGLKNQYAEGLKLLLAVSGLVLLVACANIANLLLARATANRMQCSIRLALGVSRGRVMREALGESVLLAGAGAAAGLLVAWAGTRALLLLAFRGATALPLDPRPSLPVLGFTLAVALLTAVLFGILPAWNLARLDPANALRAG